MNRITLNLAVFFLTLSSFGELRADVIFDAAADFSAVNNPNGAWSYGYRNSAVSTDFTLLPNHGHRPLTSGSGGIPDPDHVLGWWYDGGAYALPEILKNFGSTTTSPSWFSIELEPGGLVMHPYQSPASIAVIRWTAPTSGVATLSGRFYTPTVDYDINTTGLIVHNGTSLFEGSVFGRISNPTNPSFSLVQSVTAGDTIDIVVAPAVPLGGTTGVETTILLSETAVPEPATFTLLAFGAASVLAIRYRATRYRNFSG